MEKTSTKNIKYSRNESILKIGHHQSKGYSQCKILTLAQKIKFRKTCQNPFYKSFQFLFRKKPLQERLNIPEMRPFWKLAIITAKAKAHAKSSLWLKNLNSEKHVKIHFTNHFNFFFAKKPLQERLNLREMRPFWKLAIISAKATAHAKSSLWLKN